MLVFIIQQWARPLQGYVEDQIIRARKPFRIENHNEKDDVYSVKKH